MLRTLTTLVVTAMACGTNGPRMAEMDWVYAAIKPPMVMRDGTAVNLYRGWWEETEDCLGMRYDFDKVVWLIVRSNDDGTFRLNDMKNLMGYTMGRPSGGVTIMVSHKYWMTAAVVRHESVHAITGQLHGQLPEETFERCSKGSGT